MEIRMWAGWLSCETRPTRGCAVGETKEGKVSKMISHFVPDEPLLLLQVTGLPCGTETKGFPGSGGETADEREERRKRNDRKEKRRSVGRQSRKVDVRDLPRGKGIHLG